MLNAPKVQISIISKPLFMNIINQFYTKKLDIKIFIIIDILCEYQIVSYF